MGTGSRRETVTIVTGGSGARAEGSYISVRLMAGETVKALFVGDTFVRLIIVGSHGTTAIAVAGGADIIRVGDVILVVRINTGNRVENNRAAVPASTGRLDHIDIAAAMRVMTNVAGLALMGNDPVLQRRTTDAVAGDCTGHGGCKQAHVIAADSVKMADGGTVVTRFTGFVCGTVT